MRLSDRITRLTPPGNDGWNVWRRARDLAAAGTPVVQLGIGDHDIRTDPAILDAMHRAARGESLGYVESGGLPALRQAIARRVADRTGVPTGAENVAVLSGGQGAHFAAHAAACDPGDTARYIDPCFTTYPGTIRAAGAHAVAVAARAEDGFQPRAGALRRAVAAHPRVRSLLINTPHNPTGAVYGRAALEGIADLCRQADLWLISDEVYDTQVWEGAHLGPRALPGMAERTLVIGSMSKSHAMTDSRIGWLIGPAEAIAHVHNLATHTTYGLPAFLQEAALYALTQGAALEREISARYRRRRARALDILARSGRIGVVASGGAMYLMLDIRATGLDGESFALALLEAERIGVMPGESFGAAAAGHVRVALTQPEEVLAEALPRLVRFAEELAHAA